MKILGNFMKYYIIFFYLLVLTLFADSFFVSTKMQGEKGYIKRGNLLTENWLIYQDFYLSIEDFKMKLKNYVLIDDDEYSASEVYKNELVETDIEFSFRAELMTIGTLFHTYKDQPNTGEIFFSIGKSLFNFYLTTTHYIDFIEETGAYYGDIQLSLKIPIFDSLNVYSYFGVDFGNEGFFRINFGVNDEVDESAKMISGLSSYFYGMTMNYDYSKYFTLGGFFKGFKSANTDLTDLGFKDNSISFGFYIDIKFFSRY